MSAFWHSTAATADDSRGTIVSAQKLGRRTPRDSFAGRACSTTRTIGIAGRTLRNKKQTRYGTICSMGAREGAWPCPLYWPLSHPDWSLLKLTLAPFRAVLIPRFLF
jgi:hypothetical protein